MHLMITMSLALNIAVLVPVWAVLLAEAKRARMAYGAPTPERRILLSAYLAIGLVSAFSRVLPEPRLIASLLLFQVVYTLATLMTNGTVANPFALSSLGIAAFHGLPLALIRRATA